MDSTFATACSQPIDNRGNRPLRTRLQARATLVKGMMPARGGAAGPDARAPRRSVSRRARPRDPVDGVEQGLAIERLPEVPGRAGPPDALARRRVVVRGHEDDRDGDPIRGQLLLELEPGHALEIDVEDQARGAGRWH